MSVRCLDFGSLASTQLQPLYHVCVMARLLPRVEARLIAEIVPHRSLEHVYQFTRPMWARCTEMAATHRRPAYGLPLLHVLGNEHARFWSSQVAPTLCCSSHHTPKHGRSDRTKHVIVHSKCILTALQIGETLRAHTKQCVVHVRRQVRAVRSECDVHLADDRQFHRTRKTEHERQVLWILGARDVALQIHDALMSEFPRL